MYNYNLPLGSFLVSPHFKIFGCSRVGANTCAHNQKIMFSNIYIYIYRLVGFNRFSFIYIYTMLTTTIFTNVVVLYVMGVQDVCVCVCVVFYLWLTL